MVGDIFQPTHLLFVLVVALLVLGPKRLPEVGRQLGSGIRDFRAAINGEHPPSRDEIHDPYASPPAEPELGRQHEFAHETAETVSEEPVVGDSSSATAQAGHEFAHSEPGPIEDSAAGTQPAGEHEFAYEPPRSAQQPADPTT